MYASTWPPNLSLTYTGVATAAVCRPSAFSTSALRLLVWLDCGGNPSGSQSFKLANPTDLSETANVKGSVCLEALLSALSDCTSVT